MSLVFAQKCDSDIPQSTPTSNFIINPDGTVTDKRSGLTWMRCIVGQKWNGSSCGTFKPLASFRSWGEAMRQADKSEFAGFDDWRLPSLEELRSIVEVSCVNPSINEKVFPASYSGMHWTRDGYQSNNIYAWRISFEDGSENADLKEVTSYVARLVRGEMTLVKKPQVFEIETLDEMDSEALRLQRSQLFDLAQDGIHDPDNEEINLLQRPADAMAGFMRNKWGRVDWIRVLQAGEISPRTGVYTNDPMLELDMDILMKDTGSMNYVLFPHKPHTQWLACKNCHTQLFPYKTGLVDITMDDVLKGKYCGLCHGKVSFSPMLCERCHSVPKN